MGEIAEMMLDGTMDFETGEFNFDGADGPGFPLTRAQAEPFRSEGRMVRSEPYALKGDWSVLARFVGDGRAGRKEARQGLEWSKRKVGGVISAMEGAGLMQTGGSEFWMTERGLQAMRATR